MCQVFRRLLSVSWWWVGSLSVGQRDTASLWMTLSCIPSHIMVRELHCANPINHNKLNDIKLNEKSCNRSIISSLNYNNKDNRLSEDEEYRKIWLLSFIDQKTKWSSQLCKSYVSYVMHLCFWGSTSGGLGPLHAIDGIRHDQRGGKTLFKYVTYV